MIYKILALLGVVASLDIQASTYTLDQNSLFTTTSGSNQLTGTLEMDFIFGLPPLPGNDLTYSINALNLNANNTKITLSSLIIEAPAYPLVIWPYNIDLNAQNNIHNIYQIVLSLTQTALGTNLYEYQEQVLKPVAINNPGYNSITVGNNLLPSNLLFTYEWHSLIFTAQRITYPPGQLGPSWQFNTLSDTNNGTLTISAQVAAVPVPSALWLFGTGVLGLLGLKCRNNKHH